MPELGIAAQIQPTNPAAGLGQMSAILGLQQQRQALTQQALDIQRSQIETQAQQGANSFFQNWDPGQHHGEDGTLDLDSAHASSQYQALSGAARLKVEAALNTIRGQQLDNKSKLATINGVVVGQFGQTAAAAANSNDPAQRQAILDDFAKQGPDNARIYAIYGDRLKASGYNPAALRTVAAQAQDVQSQQLVRGAIVSPSGATQPTATNPQTAETTTVGRALPTGVAPTIVTPPGGVPTVMKGSGHAPAPGSATGPGVGPAPTNQDYENFGAYAANLNQRVRIASDSIPRINAAEQALDAIRGGAGTETQMAWARRLQAIGAPKSLVDAVGAGNLAAAQEAEKLLFQTTFSGLRQSMQGDPARVAEFQSAEKVFPSVGTDPRASKAILQFMREQGQRDFAEQQELVKSRKEGTFNPATWEADYQAKLRSGMVPGAPPSQIPNAAPAPTRTATTAELQAYAKKHNLSVEAARAHAVQNGFTIRE